MVDAVSNISIADGKKIPGKGTHLRQRHEAAYVLIDFRALNDSALQVGFDTSCDEFPALARLYCCLCGDSDPDSGDEWSPLSKERSR